MIRSVAVATLLALSLAACADDEAGTEPTPEATPTTTVIPDGLTPTDPGTALEYGDPATIAWQPAAELTGVLDVTVESVEEQRKSVLEGWLRDESMKQSRPYFVTVSLANVGETDLAGQVVPLYLRDDRGTIGAPWTLGGDFTACQSGPLPAPFDAGATGEVCLLYLAPDGARIDDMVFQPTEDYDPITWSGDVAPPPEAAPSRPGKKKR